MIKIGFYYEDEINYTIYELRILQLNWATDYWSLDPKAVA